MNIIIEKVRPLIITCADALDLEIVDIEWVVEQKMRILRILADGKDGLTIDEATALNEAISERLDIEDPIEEEYMLEVSSPGLERELKTAQDIIKAVGKFIHIKLYAAISGQKEWLGHLVSFVDGTLVIQCDDSNKTNMTIQKDQISKIRLAVKF